MVILHLNLIKHWFSLVRSGDKKEEYREIKKFWLRVFCKNGKIKIKGKYYDPSDVIICFSNGYRKKRPQFKIECKGFKIGTGKNKWGAKTGKKYIVIKLGKILTK